jgi:hypothetical protein
VPDFEGQSPDLKGYEEDFIRADLQHANEELLEGTEKTFLVAGSVAVIGLALCAKKLLQKRRQN